MRIPSQLGSILGGTATLAILAGCSGGGGSTPAGIPAANPGAAGQSVARAIAHVYKRTDAVRTSVMAPSSELIFGDPDLADAKAPKSGVYAGQFLATVNLYALPDSKNTKPVCTIAAANANGFGTDAKGTTWIPEVPGGTYEVATFPKNSCKAAKLTLTSPGGQPSDIAFTTTGTTYVLNIVNSTTGMGSIAVYPKGSTTPSGQLTPPGIAGYGLGIATDTKNNVYVSYQTSSGSDIAVFAGGKGAGKVLYSSSDTLIGLTFDDKENLLAADASATAVDVFAPPYTKAPKATAQKGEPVDLKLDATNKNLYVGDYGLGQIDVFKYPAMTYEYSINNGLSQANDVEGVAVDPSDNN